MKSEEWDVERERVETWIAAVRNVVSAAERAGVIVTVERKPIPCTPLAQGNHFAHVSGYITHRKPT